MTKLLTDMALDILLGDPSYAENTQSSFYVPAREAVYARPSNAYQTGGVGRWIFKDKRFVNGLWKHAEVAFEQLEQGANVAVTTKTASGKTTIMIGRTLRILDENPDATFLTIYPAKALQFDQLQSWQNAFKSAGHKESDIGVINGDEREDDARMAVIKKAKNITITPDTIQSWLLPNCDDPFVRNFLSRIELVSLDEAHVYSEMLGSHAPHLLRRLQFAIDHARRLKKVQPSHRSLIHGPVQFLALSASLRDAPAFMKRLTGQDFVEVGAIEDGSPSKEKDVIHLAADPDDQLKVARHLIKKLLTDPEESSGAIVCFVDSRQKVEKLASDLNHILGHEIVSPYRGSYTSADRETIHYEIKNGDRRAIISTSVAELGLDFSELSVGICVGKPESAASLQQRLGRVGRSGKGVFVVIASKTAFGRGRKSIPLAKYCSGESVELNTYMDHPSIVAGHVLCLQREIKLLGLEPDVSLNQNRYGWTDAFMKTMEKLRVGHAILSEDHTGYLLACKKNPHRATTLRDVYAGLPRTLMAKLDDGTVINLGSLTGLQAVREAYPGAIFPHRLMRFKVEDWYSPDPKGQGKKHTDARIRLSRVHTRQQTRPILQVSTYVPVGQSLPYAKMIGNASSNICERRMTVSERVIGYDSYMPAHDGEAGKGTRQFYNQSDTDDKGPARKYQYITRTTGILFNFSPRTFAIGDSENEIEDNILKLGRLLRSAVAERLGLSINQIGYSATKIYETNIKGENRELEHALVLFDNNSSNLRLTRHVITQLDGIIELMGFDALGDERNIVAQFAKFYNRLSGEAVALAPEKTSVSTGEQEGPIIRPGAIMWHQTKRETTSRSAGTPQGRFVEVVGSKRIDGQLMYGVKPYDNPLARKSRTVRPEKSNMVQYVSPRTLSEGPPV